MNIQKIKKYFKENYYLKTSIIVFVALILVLLSFFLVREENIKLEKQYEVTLDYNNGTSNKIIKVKNGEYLSIISEPVLEGYTFTGWYYKDKLFDFNTKITKNLTLVAKYTENTGTEENSNLVNNGQNNLNDSTNNGGNSNSNNNTSTSNNSSGNSGSTGNNTGSSGSNNSGNGSTDSSGGNVDNNPIYSVGGNNCVNSGICNVGDEIELNINNLNYDFNVLSDNGTTLVLLMSQNLPNTVPWISSSHYSGSCPYPACNDLGPKTALEYLGSQTSVWSSSGIKVRMPTEADINSVCSGDVCPCFIYNYLNGNRNVCRENTIVSNQQGYWLANSGEGGIDQAKMMFNLGYIDETSVTSTSYGVRPVIEIAKK